MKIAVFGTGYVGLVTGACLARVGNDIVCIDVDKEKVERLKNGECPIFEPGLEDVLKEVIAAGRLTFTTDPTNAIKESTVLMSAVGTPPDEDGSADLQYVLQVAQTIGEQMEDYKVIVTKSTVPPLTGDKVEEQIKEALIKRGADVPFDVVSNPEFLKEGSAVEDFLKPDRIIVGTNSDQAKKTMEDLYKPFMRQGYKVIFMDRVSAEVTKYAANSMLATRISFVNEMARIAEKVGANIEEIRVGIGSDARIGKQFLYAGPGYGGSCFPKDVKAIAHLAHDLGVTPTLLDAVEQVNKEQRQFFLDKITAHYGGDLSGKKLAVWGLAFKANTDDVRESPATTIVDGLLQAGATVNVFDPEAHDTFKAHTEPGKEDRVTYADDQYTALDDADALVVVTEWQHFRSPNLDTLKEKLAAPVVFDARNLYDPADMKDAGFTYISIGR